MESGSRNEPLQLVVLPTYKQEVERLFRESRSEFYESESQGKIDKNSLCTYVGTMVKLQLSQELYFLSHQIVEKRPQEALAWYSVACYYYTARKLDAAFKNLKKALKKESELVVGWLLLGHVLSQQEESEQAVSAYRSAVRLLPNHYLPLLCLGKEFIRTSNYSLAAHTLAAARTLNPGDVTVLNDLGVVFARLDRLSEALQFFNWALSIVQMEQEQLMLQNQNVSQIMFNFATVLRKLKVWDEALMWYERSLTLGPQQAETMSALAFTLHMCGKFHRAIDLYQRALGIDPRHNFATEMLTLALEDEIGFDSPIEEP